MPKIIQQKFYIFKQEEVGSPTVYIIRRTENTTVDANPSQFREEPRIHKMSVEAPIKASTLKHVVSLFFEKVNELRGQTNGGDTIYISLYFCCPLGWDMELVINPTVANCRFFRDLTRRQQRRFRRILAKRFRKQKTMWQQLKQFFGLGNQRPQKTMPPSTIETSANGGKKLEKKVKAT